MLGTVTLATKTKSEDTTATVQYTLVLFWLIMHFFIFVTSLETQVCKQVGLYQHCSDLLLLFSDWKEDPLIVGNEIFCRNQIHFNFFDSYTSDNIAIFFSLSCNTHSLGVHIRNDIHIRHSQVIMLTSGPGQLKTSTAEQISTWKADSYWCKFCQETVNARLRVDHSVPLFQSRHYTTMRQLHIRPSCRLWVVLKRKYKKDYTAAVSTAVCMHILKCQNQRACGCQLPYYQSLAFTL